jgi:putative ABC transport system permease protein
VTWSLRSLAQHRGRLLANVGAVALAVALMLVLLALIAGTVDQYTNYAEHIDAAVFVAQRGAASLLEPSLLPASVGEDVARVKDVEAVSAIYGQVVTLSLDGRTYPAYLLGYDTNRGMGGPWAVAAGKPAPRRGEALVDAGLAARLGLALGDQVAVPGRTLKIVGLTRDSGFRYPYIFVDQEDAGVMLGLPERLNYLLVGVRPGADAAAVAATINSEVPAVSAYPRAAFIRNSAEPLERTVLPAMRLMFLVGLLVSILVIAFTVYASVVDRQRELATVKAIGAGSIQLYTFTLEPALVSALLGFVAGLLLTELLVFLLPRLTGGVAMRLDYEIVLVGLVLALAIAALAAVAPVLRLLHLEPAEAFRN